MAKKAEGDLDEALATLAHELRATGPSPGPAMTGRVLTDAAVASLAHEVHAGAPRPSPALVARVLADAATVASAAAPASRPGRTAVRTAAGARRRGIAELLFGWTAGAAAAMALGLGVGLGVGLAAGPGTLPLLDRAEADLPVALAEAEPAMLLMDGL